MSLPLVVVTDFLSEPLELERKILGDAAEVRALGAMGESELGDKLDDADAVMIYHFITLGRATIERMKRCKLIVRCGVGYDNVDHAAARELGIPVANVPDYGTEEVADSAIGMTLALTRGIYFLSERCKNGVGDWIYSQVRPLHRLRGETFGIVGLGRIGIATALRAKALGMKVIYYDPLTREGMDKAAGVVRVETLSELLEQSLVVSMHCPSTPLTRHLINDDAIAQMRSGSFLVNTARGVVVDAMAVVRGIENGKLAGAALDVLEVEPPAANDPVIRAWRDPQHPAHDRLIINPHSAFYSEEGLDEMRIKGSQNCLRALRGQPLRNVINDMGT